MDISYNLQIKEKEQPELTGYSHHISLSQIYLFEN